LKGMEFWIMARYRLEFPGYLLLMGVQSDAMQGIGVGKSFFV